MDSRFFLPLELSRTALLAAASQPRVFARPLVGSNAHGTSFKHELLTNRLRESSERVRRLFLFCFVFYMKTTFKRLQCKALFTWYCCFVCSLQFSNVIQLFPEGEVNGGRYTSIYMYLALFTNPERDSCFSIYQVSWLKMKKITFWKIENVT